MIPSNDQVCEGAAGLHHGVVGSRLVLRGGGGAGLDRSSTHLPPPSPQDVLDERYPTSLLGVLRAEFATGRPR